MDKEGENTKIRQFLLGSQPEAEAQEIGARIIADPGFAEKMSFAEEALVEDFLDDALTPSEKELFNENFLITPARAALLKETALFRNYARLDAANASERVQEEKKSGNFLDRLKGFLALNLRPIAAALMILVIAGIGWRVFLYNADGGFTPLEKEYAALNAKDLNDPAETGNLPTRSLVTGTFRDTDSASKLNAANLTGDVLFRLALPPETPRGARFDLALVRGGQTVFRQANLRVYQNPSGQELKVVLPKSVLSKGAHQLKLNNGATYGLTVE